MVAELLLVGSESNIQAALMQWLIGNTRAQWLKWKPSRCQDNLEENRAFHVAADILIPFFSIVFLLHCTNSDERAIVFHDGILK